MAVVSLYSEVDDVEALTPQYEVWSHARLDLAAGANLSTHHLLIT